MHRLVLAIAVIAGLPGAVQAAPLCHDLKGLFTPCPPGTPSQNARHRSRSVDDRASQSADATSDQATPLDAARPLKLAKPPLIGRGKSCRDSKGLFKPC